MTSTAPMAGALQIAAALVFHLPGARLELTSPSGRQCSVGPMTDPRCTLHPAEFRELVLAAGNCQLLGTLLGFALVDEPTMTLTSSGVDMDHLGGGLYRVVGCEFISFAFTTPLEAHQVDGLLSALPETRYGAHGPREPGRSGDDGFDGPGRSGDDGFDGPGRSGDDGFDGSGRTGDDGVTMCVSLVRDDGLGVTLVVISPFDPGDVACCEAVARSAVSACLVAEMEHLSACLDEAPS